MSILINKNGKQLGPYSLDEARQLVLAGELDPHDWAWPDGATDWIPLNEVPGYARPSKAAAAAAAARPAAAGSIAAVRAAAASPSATSAEIMMWSGHPSQILNLSIYIFWFAILVLAAVALYFMGVFDESHFWTAVIFGSVAAMALINCLIAFFHLRAIEYNVSTQRVRVVTGLFGKTIQEIELFRVKDTMAHQSFLLRLFGLGTITVLSSDETQPQLVLTGVPKALDLRERLRTEVMNLRQRYGVREVDVM